jgi:hypothetical protein
LDSFPRTREEDVDGDVRRRPRRTVWAMACIRELCCPWEEAGEERGWLQEDLWERSQVVDLRISVRREERQGWQRVD